jgi:hypothetical protein
MTESVSSSPDGRDVEAKNSSSKVEFPVTGTDELEGWLMVV